MSEMVSNDYRQLCEQYECKIEELNKQNEELQKMVKERDFHIQYKTNEIARLEGRVAGLAFALRCNGVSGGEVTI